ncbi:hypothetical protein OC845_000658 [Tilletia horrida]|nr:hypothetical protein OC845_000658 [Tilletia horrida]
MISIRTLAKLSKEVHALVTSPLPGIRLTAASSSQDDANTSSSSVSPEDDVLHLRAWIKGPPDTPYAGGYFAIDINIEKAPSFPAEPPRCTFATQIFHPNVSRSGEICVSTLKKDWKPEYGIGHILLTIKCLLMAPNPDSALDPESARLLQEEYDEYCRIARLWTSVHAPASRCPVKLFADEVDDQQREDADNVAVDPMQVDEALSVASSSRVPTAAAADPSRTPRTSSPGPLGPVVNVPTLIRPSSVDEPGDEAEGGRTSNSKLRGIETQKPEVDLRWSPGPSRHTGLAPPPSGSAPISCPSSVAVMPKLGSPMSPAVASFGQGIDQVPTAPSTKIQAPVSAAAFSSSVFKNGIGGNVLGLFPNQGQDKIVLPKQRPSSEMLVRQLPTVLKRGLKRL